MSIYLDHNASSPMHPEVADAILPFLQNPVGNASSLHSLGRMARSAIETARSEVAQLINCNPDEVIFTSGGTEANNLLLKGFADKSVSRPLVSTPVEHPSVLEPLKQLAREGASVVYLDVDSNGCVDLDVARNILQQEDPQLLSVISANNETGVIQPVSELAHWVDQDRCLFHSDATQVVGKLPVDMKSLGLDALSFSAHKLQGPQGIGALVVNRKPGSVLISGGEQENRRRAGTENVAMIVGLGKSAQIARLELEQKQHHLKQLQELFETRLADMPGCVIFGKDAERLPNTTYFALPYYHGETLLMELDRAGFAMSSGSACHSEVTKPSHVLTAMGVDDTLALNAVRVSFGMSNNLQEVELLINQLQHLVNKLPAVMRQAAV
ncbi:MAG: cysteine desulfurase family protein [Pseudomonadota bacterium]